MPVMGDSDLSQLSQQHDGKIVWVFLLIVIRNWKPRSSQDLSAMSSLFQEFASFKMDSEIIPLEVSSDMSMKKNGSRLISAILSPGDEQI